MWFNFSYFLTGDFADVEPVRDAAVIEAFEERQLLLGRCDYYLSTNVVFDAMLFAELNHGAVTACGEPRFKTARLVIDPRMNDATIASALMERQPWLLF